MEKVLIRGMIFDRSLKGPFSKSGASILGALEYQGEEDKVRCHECGEWYVSLAAHARLAHHITAEDYRLRHGLHRRTALMGFKSANHHGETAHKFTKGNKVSKESGARMAASNFQKKYKRAKESVETRNLTGRCREQIIAKIRHVGKTVKRTPTLAELKVLGITHGTLINAFGSVAEAIEAAGFTPRPAGKNKSWAA